MLDEFQKETVASIREITLQLILISVGVFTLLGSFATAENKSYRSRPLLWIAFISLIASVICGLLTYGNVIWQLSKSQFEPFGDLETLAQGQWVTFAIGGVLLAFFVLRNIKRGP